LYVIGARKRPPAVNRRGSPSLRLVAINVVAVVLAERASFAANGITAFTPGGQTRHARRGL
jgi:hypothetical protein